MCDSLPLRPLVAAPLHFAIAPLAAPPPDTRGALMAPPSRRHVGVVLRKLYVRNPCAPPCLRRVGEDQGLEAIQDNWVQELGLDRICLAQVRWATSGCVQTYRVGTYGRGKDIVTVSDLTVAPEMDDEAAAPLRRLYEFRGRSEALEDIATLVIGDAIPSPVALEDILVRFFRPRPNAMALMHHVSNVLLDEKLGVSDRMCSTCDFCELPLDPGQGIDAVAPACRSCEMIGHDWCACEAEGQVIVSPTHKRHSRAAQPLMLPSLATFHRTNRVWVFPKPTAQGLNLDPSVSMQKPCL